MTWEIPLTELRVSEDDVEEVLECLRSGWLTMGPRTEQFETAFAEWVGSPHAVSVSSGTAALHLALLALGIGEGDEVIVPGFTFVATAAAARFVGATPVLCDVTTAEHPLLDPADVLRHITPRTRAVIAVHFFGYPAPLRELRELCDAHGVALVEDVAQAIGAIVDESGSRAGTIGDVATFSLFSKNQLSVGEGGVVTSPDEQIAQRVKSLRSHAMTSGTWDRHLGHAATYDVAGVGFNFRIDEPRAALATSRLASLTDEIDARRDRVRRYRQLAAGIPGVSLMFTEPEVEAASHFAFPVLLPGRAERDAVRVSLRADGIQTTWYPALTQLTAFRQAASVSRAEDVADRHCALPLSSFLTDADQDRVVESLRAAVAAF
jgi:dTDP-4-amino-4,6-dideoxygalactose transaminase